MSDTTSNPSESSPEEPHRDSNTLRRLYWEEDLTLREIGDRLGTSGTTVYREMVRRGIPRRRPGARVKPYASFCTNPHTGYERWNARTDDDEVWVLVHRLLAVAEHGFDEVCDKHVHHRNEIPWDNRPENLEVMTPSEHSRHHARERDGEG